MSGRRRVRPKAPQKPATEAACAHAEAKLISFIGRGHVEEHDVALEWCASCGALGSVRYADGEARRWVLPGKGR